MRGEHFNESWGDMKEARFIPACAGNTIRKPGDTNTYFGSSPHARGTLFPYIAAKKMN